MKKSVKKPDNKVGLFGASLIALSGMVAAGPALAQDAPEAEGEEEIIVTGSRLRQENFDSPNPTVQVGAEQIDAAQSTNVIDQIEDVPLIAIGSNNRGGQVQNGDSFAFPNILNLGSQRTLTLVNGRRVVPNIPSTFFVPGNNQGVQVDLSTFNPQVVQRVDVVAGTGGAIYGADAVAGVINIITKDNFEGLDIRAQAGVTELGDGENYRLSGLWGTNFGNDRGNINISAEYSDQELITASTDTNARYWTTVGNPPVAANGAQRNPLDGGTRNTAAFDIASAITTLTSGGTLPTPFNPAASDRESSGIFPFGSTVTQQWNGLNGVLVTGPGPLAAGFANNTAIVPGTTVHPNLANNFFAPNALSAGDNANPVPGLTGFGLTGGQIGSLSLAQQRVLLLQLQQRNRPTPYEYLLANPGINPNFFYGTFGSIRGDNGALNALNGAFPTVTNTDATILPGGIAANVLFPRVAVPLQFTAGGNLTAYGLGALQPGIISTLGLGFNVADAYDPAKADAQIQAGTERLSLASYAGYDFTDWLRYRSEINFARATFEQTAGTQTNGPGGSVTGGSLSIPVYLDQNPFVSVAARNQITALQAAPTNLALPTITTQPGARVMFMGRTLEDLYQGGAQLSTTETETYRIVQALEGDFSMFGRDFYWDVAAGYGESKTETEQEEVLDIEFALAVDVVDGDPGPGVTPVCRQQTLGAPEDIALRNPLMAGVLIGSGRVPTAAQVAACVPLNLFGANQTSAAARDYVMGDSNRESENSQEFYTASLGGDIFDLPGGPVALGLNIEQRSETFAFRPNLTTQLGQGRTALQGTGEGESEFTEYGYEVRIPIFGEGFSFPLLEELEIGYAFRKVEREFSALNGSSGGADNDTFNYSFRWKPIEDLTLRGARSRTVRSPALSEVATPFTLAFSNLGGAFHPCSTASIGLGPAPANRRQNCRQLLWDMGIVANPDAGGVTAIANADAFLLTFAGTGGVRAAQAAGNPALSEEEGNAYTLGLTYEPHFIENLTLAVDFFSIDISNVIGLVGPFINECFDEAPAAFGDTIVGGVFRACDTFLLGVDGGGGNFINPAVNTITGNPSFATPLNNQQAFVNAPFEVTLAQFNNINLARQELRSVNFEARYNFALGDVPFIGGPMANWGDIFLRGTLYHNQRFDQFSGSAFADRFAGEHASPEYEWRLDFRHRLGALDHTLQWFWNSETVTDRLSSETIWPEQAPQFVAPDFHYFNYNLAYDVTDNMTFRLVVNNLFDTTDPRGELGFTNQYDGGVGRNYVVGFQARF